MCASLHLGSGRAANNKYETCGTIGSDRPVVRGHNSVQPCFGQGVRCAARSPTQPSQRVLPQRELSPEGTPDATTRKNSVRFKAPLLRHWSNDEFASAALTRRGCLARETSHILAPPAGYQALPDGAPCWLDAILQHDTPMRHPSQFVSKRASQSLFCGGPASPMLVHNIERCDDTRATTGFLQSNRQDADSCVASRTDL